MKPLPPFRLDLTAWALRRTSTNLVDRSENGTYHRVIMIESVPVEVRVTQQSPVDTPRLTVSAITRHSVSQADIRRVTECVLGIRVDKARSMPGQKKTES